MTTAAAQPTMRDIIFEYLRGKMRDPLNGVGGRFDHPLINLPYHGAHTKYATDVEFISVLWDLVAEGIIMPGFTDALRQIGNTDQKAWPFYTLTPRGLDVISGNTATTSPHDESRYLADARARLPHGDDAIALYLEEATRAFVARLYLSSVVMLGVSAEALTEWLIKRMNKHLNQQPSALSKFTKDLNKVEFKTAARFARLMAEIDAHRSELPRDLTELVGSQLVTVLNILKAYRDDVAHRRPFRVDPQLADGQLKLYLPTLSVASELSDVLDKPCSLTT